MTRRIAAWTLALLMGLVCALPSVKAQGPTLPDPESGGSPGGDTSLLGQAPGSGGGTLGTSPGSSDNPLGGRPGPSQSRAPASISNPNAGFGPRLPGVNIPTPAALPSAEIPVYGALDFPSITDDQGPEDGLTLDNAIELLVRDNLSLKGLAYELPQAEADIITAGLRNNPVFYADTQLVPYGQYTKQRPGGQTQYDVNISYPFDVNRKRLKRIDSANKAKAVLEEQYRNAVRTEIDNLYTVYVDVLAAKATLRYAEAGVKGLDQILIPIRARGKFGVENEAEELRVTNQREISELGRADAEESLRKAQRQLATILAMPSDQAETLEIRGTLRDTAPVAPSLDELIQIAQENRPDLVAFRRGVDRANADVRLQYANRFTDIYVLYQPYTFQDNTPNGLKSPTSWALGVTVPLPIYNRNQGNILRAKQNVAQTQTQLMAQIRLVLTDVQQAEREYLITRSAVSRFETVLAPRARRILEIERQRNIQGADSFLVYLSARNEYVAVVKQYLDTLIRHRRAMLDLNTAVGRRILP